MVSSAFWAGKKVLLTGNTGFKGAWLSLWLESIGASVRGFSLQPPSSPSLFRLLEAGSSVNTHIGDIRDLLKLKEVVRACSPDIVFHMAAQPLVRTSYSSPIETFDINVMGTVNFLEALRGIDSVKSIIVVTSDKCYKNREWDWAYRELDELGGRDPYSSSKACAELVVSAYSESFFNSDVGVATVRAGNVIGGGDWAENRLIPDLMRAYHSDKKIEIRYPESCRPWQFVLEPLEGYLLLAEKLFLDAGYSGAWNFGPSASESKTVGWVVNRICELIGEELWVGAGGSKPYEAKSLRIDSSKSEAHLDWKPRTDINRAIELTVDWYKAFMGGQDMRTYSMNLLPDSMERP